MTKSARETHIEAIKNKGTINAFDCMFYPCPKTHNQEQLTSTSSLVEVSQPKSKKPYMPASVKKAILAGKSE